MNLIISPVYTNSRFLELSEFELKSELEKELWRRLNDLYAGYIGENTDYKGMSYEDLINEIESKTEEITFLENNVSELEKEQESLEDALNEATNNIEDLEDELERSSEKHIDHLMSYNTIIVEYLKQICKKNSTIGEIDVNAICTHLKCYDYSSAYETLYDICTEELKNQYPLLETILEELRNHE